MFKRWLCFFILSALVGCSTKTRFYSSSYTPLYPNTLRVPKVKPTWVNHLSPQRNTGHKSLGKFNPVKKEATAHISFAPVEKSSSLPSLLRLPAFKPAMGQLIKFQWPVKGKIISTYGAKPHHLFNDGIDIGAPKGKPIKATAQGKVTYTGEDIKSYGQMVLIKHSYGWISAYAHLNEVCVKERDNVKQGQVIGYVGDSGHTSVPKLHFELRQGIKTFNPLEYLGKEK